MAQFARFMTHLVLCTMATLITGILATSIAGLKDSSYLLNNTKQNALEHILYRDLMQHYEKDVRPTHDHRLPTNVTFGFLLNQLVDVDEKNQVFTTRAWLNINWMDRRLSWDMEHYNNITTIYAPHYRLWKPDIMLTNNADPNLKDAVMSTDVAIQSDGNVTWLFAAIYRSPCQIDVRYYPFDDQKCFLHFACWSHMLSEIDLMLITERGDLSNYLNNSEFNLLDMIAIREVESFPARPNSLWPMITIMIHLRRRPLFYVFNHILPCVLICSMGLLGFYMPPDTGEKVTTCITTMLSMGVYLKTITEIIPPTSEAVPLIGVYYVVSLMIVCAATVMNAVTLNLYRKGCASQQGPASPWVKKFVLGYMARILMVRLPSHMEMEVALAYHRDRRATLEELNAFQDYSAQRREASQNVASLGTFKRRTSSATTSRINGWLPKVRLREQTGEGAVLKQRPSNASVGEPRYAGINPAIHTDLSGAPPTTESANAPSLRMNKSSHGDFIFPKLSDSPLPISRQLRKPDAQTSFSDVQVGLAEVSDELSALLTQVTMTLQAHERRLAIQDAREHIQLEWQQLALVLDRALFWIFFCFTCSVIVILLFKPAFFDDKLDNS